MHWQTLRIRSLYRCTYIHIRIYTARCTAALISLSVSLGQEYNSGIRYTLAFPRFFFSHLSNPLGKRCVATFSSVAVAAAGLISFLFLRLYYKGAKINTNGT